MAAALKPGGWLLIQEPDFHLAPTTEPDVWATTWKALLEWGRGNARRCLSVAGGLELLAPVLDDDSRVAAQVASVSACDFRPIRRSA